MSEFASFSGADEEYASVRKHQAEVVSRRSLRQVAWKLSLATAALDANLVNYNYRKPIPIISKAGRTTSSPARPWMVG
jgi:hypothetical protein